MNGIPKSIQLSLNEGKIEASYPIRLRGDHSPSPGPAALFLNGQLERGAYRLRIRIREAVHNQLLTVHLNGHPVDALGVPFAGDSDDNWPGSRRDGVTNEKLAFTQGVKDRYQLAALYERRLAERVEWVLETSFVVNEERKVEMELRNSNGDRCGPLFYAGDGVEVLGLELLRDTRRAPDTFSRRNPGLPMLDAWGWMAYINFDNPQGLEASWEEIAEQAVRKARKWGANLIEVNPAVAGGHFLDVRENGKPLPGIGRATDTRWTVSDLRCLFALAHKNGMLAELFLFSLDDCAILDAMTSEQILLFYRTVNEMFGCVGGVEQLPGAVDGAIYEMFPHDAPRETDEAWQCNPGVMQMVSGGITGTAMELKNNGYSAGFANYVAHWVGSDAHHTGYDWLFPAAPYPRDFYRRNKEIAFYYLQGCAESRRPCEDSCVRDEYAHKGIPARSAAPDWIYSQILAFAQRRWRDESDTVASALCWEAVDDGVCPPETKRAVYAVSQDPIRSCLTGTLKDTGRGGTIDLKRMLKKQPPQELTRLLPRHAWPDDTRFVRNQELEMLFFPGKDFNVLNLDLSRSAKFYGNGNLVQIFAPFFAAPAMTNEVGACDEIYQVLEPGGALAEVAQVLNVREHEGERRETRHLRLLSDLPGLRLEVTRQALAPAAKPRRVANYICPDEHYEFVVLAQNASEVQFALHDKDGLLPEVLLRVSVEGAEIEDLKLRPGISFHTAIGESHKVTVELLLASGHLQGQSAKQLADLLGLFEPRIYNLEGSEALVHVASSYPIAVSAVIALKPAADVACRVRERGWWHYRGVTESIRHPNRDYLKVLHYPGEEATISRDSLIGGEITWGWGSQHTVLISDIRERDGWYRPYLPRFEVLP